jgi:hypothetical protein
LSTLFRRPSAYTLVAALLVSVCASCFAAGASAPLDLNDPAQRLDAYIRTVGDTSGKESYSYASAIVYAHVPGEKPRALFGLEVVGASRFLKIDGGYQRLHREIGFYTDLKTGEVLQRWFNPYLQREVEVLAIQNDPVNRKFVLGERTTYNYQQVGNDIVFYREVPLRYPNPIDPTSYPQYSSGEFYEAIEMFNNFVSRKDLQNRKLTSVPSTSSWTRMGPWLPWMEMGRHQGYLLYHSRGFKPQNGVAGLPPKLRAQVAAVDPKYLSAPETLVTPDETSWTYFKKLLDARKAAAQPPRY